MYKTSKIPAKDGRYSSQTEVYKTFRDYKHNLYLLIQGIFFLFNCTLEKYTGI